jgi:hypothetical protein
MDLDTSMSVDELLQLLDDYSIGGTLEEVSVVVETILPLILDSADFYFNEYAEDDICSHAVALASNAIKDFPDGEDDVRDMLDHVGKIAGDLINRAEGLSPATRARLEVIRDTRSDWADIGVIGVDSATIAIGDPCHLHDPQHPLRDWSAYCIASAKEGQPNVKQLNFPLGHAALGLVIRTRSDGGCPVQARFVNGYVAEVRIQIFDETEARLFGG